jgi:hypothetical protein
VHGVQSLLNGKRLVVFGLVDVLTRAFKGVGLSRSKDLRKELVASRPLSEGSCIVARETSRSIWYSQLGTTSKSNN